MSVFESVKRAFGLGVEQKSTTLTDPHSLEFFGVVPTVSGKSVGPAEAMRVPAVRAAVTLISDMVGATSFKLYERTEAGKRPAPEHPVYRLIHDEPNEETGAEEFRAILTMNALLTDNGFAYVNRVEGRPVELLPLDPLKVQIKQTQAGETFYEFQDATGRRVFHRDDILRFKAPGGVSPIKHAREAIAQALVLEEAATRIFSKAGRPANYLLHPGTLGDDAAKRMSDSWHDAHSGANSGRTAILEEGMKPHDEHFKSVDAQFQEMRQFQILEIARAFNVPPTMLQDLAHGKFDNVEALHIHFRTYTLHPLLLSWARAYGRALLSPGERARFFVEPVYDSLIAADTKTRSEALTGEVAGMIRTPNEARALVNLPWHPDGDRLLNPNTTSSTTDRDDPEPEEDA